MKVDLNYFQFLRFLVDWKIASGPGLLESTALRMAIHSDMIRPQIGLNVVTKFSQKKDFTFLHMMWGVSISLIILIETNINISLFIH